MSRPIASQTTTFPVLTANQGWRAGSFGIAARDAVRVVARPGEASGRVISFSGGSGHAPGRVSEGAE